MWWTECLSKRLEICFKNDLCFIDNDVIVQKFKDC